MVHCNQNTKWSYTSTTTKKWSERAYTDKIHRQMMRELYRNEETLKWYTYLLMPSLHILHKKGNRKTAQTAEMCTDKREIEWVYKSQTNMIMCKLGHIYIASISFGIWFNPARWTDGPTERTNREKVKARVQHCSIRMANKINQK